jgi:peptide/nickel transport system permease protein
MREYLSRRLILFMPTLILASLAIFFAMRVIPGDIASVILSEGGENQDLVSAEQAELLREKLGLNDPLPLQYGKWIWSMVNGSFGGESLLTGEPISDMVSRRILVTVQLALYTIVVSMVVAVPLGVLAAVKQDTWTDYVIRIITILGHALPNFWVALMIILGLVLYFSWSPPIRYKALWDDPSMHFQKVIWPVLVLSWGYSAYLTRITRSNVLEVLRQDYIRTARSKGLREFVVFGRHALRNALIPVITVGGLYLGALLSGTVILEALFGLPGMGQGIVQAASNRDYPVIQSLTLLMVFFMLIINLAVDLLYVVIDPRISYSR